MSNPLSESGYVPYDVMIDVQRKDDHRRVKGSSDPFKYPLFSALGGKGKVRSGKTERWAGPDPSRKLWGEKMLSYIKYTEWHYNEEKKQHETVMMSSSSISSLF